MLPSIDRPSNGLSLSLEYYTVRTHDCLAKSEIILLSVRDGALATQRTIKHSRELIDQARDSG